MRSNKSSTDAKLISVLLRGAGASGLLKIVSMGLTFIAQIIFARTMGIEQYGIYTYVLAWFNILLLFSVMGWDTTLVRYVSAYRVKASWSLMKGLLKVSTQYALLASAVVGVLAMIALWFFQANVSTELFYSFFISFLMLPVWAITHLRTSALKGMKHIVLEQLPYPFQVAVLIVMTITISKLFGRSLHSHEALMLNLLASIAMLIISHYWFSIYVHRHVQITEVPFETRYQANEWIKVTLPLLFTSGIYLFLNQIDIIMMGSLRGTTEAGIYSVASRITTLLALGLTSASAITAPTISELYIQRQWHKLQQTVNVALWVGLGFAVPIFIVLMVAGGYILTFFGPEFVAGTTTLQILAANQLFNTITGPSGHLMTMTNYHNQYVVILAIALATNGLLNYLLIPQYGMTGAALATSVSNIGMNLSVVVFVYRSFGIRSFIS